MIKKRIVASLLAVSLAAPVLMSCSKKGSDTVVSENDPWYESTRFELDMDILPTEMLGNTEVCYGNGKIYHVYGLTNLADYDNYRRTMLDAYDEKGNRISSIKLKDPAGYSIERVDILGSPDEKNQAEAVVNLFAQGGFEDAVVKINLESGEVTDPKFFKDEKGNPIEISLGGQDVVGITKVYAAGEYYIPVIIAVREANVPSVNAYVFKGSEFVCRLDFSGLINVLDVEEFSFDASNGALCTVGYTRNEGQLVLKFDAKTGKKISSDKYDMVTNLDPADYKAVPSGDLCKIDTLGNITKLDLQAGEAKTVVDNNWYTPYFSDLSAEKIKLISCDSDRTVIYSMNSTEYSMFFSGYNESVTILTKCEKNPNAGKKIIELATPIDKNITEYLSNAIYEFNRTDNEYLIKVWSKYKTGIKTGRDFSILHMDSEKVYTMIQELKGKDAPDLAVGIQQNYAMRDDIFEDLTGYLDQAVADQQFGNIIEASKIGGKQYFLPVTLEIEGLVTDRSYVKDGAVGITFEDFDKMVREKLDGFTPYDYPESRFNNRKAFLLSCTDTKAAIEGGQANFGTDQFYAAAEYTKDHFTKNSYEQSDTLEWADEVKKPRTGCRYETVDSFIKFVHACKSSEGSYTILGTPSVDARGPRFRAIETISVTALSDVKDGCRKFINFLFAGAGFGESSREFLNLVTNKEIMARNVSIITEKNNEGTKSFEELGEYMGGVSEYVSVYGYKYSTKDMEEAMLESMSKISTYTYDDPVLTAFLVEDTAPYYAGDRSLDDVVRIINDRATKYIKEM